MFRATTLLILMSTNSIFAQMYCEDDVQCSDGLFCEQFTSTCRPCMGCSELNRNPLPKQEEYICVKTDGDCGPCLQSFTANQWNSKCVQPEDKPHTSAIVVGFACAAIGLLIIGIFIHVITHTNVYEIVGYYVLTKRQPLPSSVGGYPMTKIKGVLVSRAQEVIA